MMVGVARGCILCNWALRILLVVPQLLLHHGGSVRRTELIPVISSSWHPSSRILMGLDTVSMICAGVASAASQWGALSGTLFYTRLR